LEQNIPEEYRSHPNSKKYPYAKAHLKSDPYSYGGHSYTFEYMEKRWQEWKKKFDVIFPS
jgi:hypothetical protein